MGTGAGGLKGPSTIEHDDSSFDDSGDDNMTHEAIVATASANKSIPEEE